jgi:hypothetical protein
MTGTLGINLQIFDYYGVIENLFFDEQKPFIENAYTYEENGVYYCASATQKGFYRYSYCLNNPLMLKDPTGQLFTKFLDHDGNVIQDINDGSNAVFQLTGSTRAEEHFEFKGYENNPNKSNYINLESVIKAAQDYTLKNYLSKANAEGKYTTTYCNQGTMNIARSYESAVKASGQTTNISDIQGTSRTIGDNLSKSNLVESLATIADAQKAAKEGSLVIGYWPGHIFTLNKDGMVNNVGAPRATNNIFDPKYGNSAQKFYMLILNP